VCRFASVTSKEIRVTILVTHKKLRISANALALGDVPIHNLQLIAEDELRSNGDRWFCNVAHPALSETWADGLPEANAARSPSASTMKESL
jgi:hypothetical protein